MPGAEQDGKGSQGDAEAQGENVGRGFLGQFMQGLGDSANLQSDIGQGADEHEQGDQHPHDLAAVTEGEQIGEGTELVFAGEAQYRTQQYRTQGESQGHAQVNGKKQIAVGIGQTDAAIVGPGGGIDAQ